MLGRDYGSLFGHAREISELPCLHLHAILIVAFSRGHVFVARKSRGRTTCREPLGAGRTPGTPIGERRLGRCRAGMLWSRSSTCSAPSRRRLARSRATSRRRERKSSRTRWFSRCRPALSAAAAPNARARTLRALIPALARRSRGFAAPATVVHASSLGTCRARAAGVGVA